jgi:hypothetical protein
MSKDYTTPQVTISLQEPMCSLARVFSSNPPAYHVNLWTKALLSQFASCSSIQAIDSRLVKLNAS